MQSSMDAIASIHSAAGVLHNPMHGRLLALHMPKVSKHGHVSLCALYNYEGGITSTSNLEIRACVPTARRSANYKPPFWSFDYIQSLSTEYGESRYLERASELVQQVKIILLDEETAETDQLTLIDALQRLGISYHFQVEIDQVLERLYTERYCTRYNNNAGERPLRYMALEFRLLRQHGFSVPEEVFDCYKNRKGDFDPRLGIDVEGLLQLYEASFLLTPGERTLELAMEFSTELLEEKLAQDSLSVYENVLVCHALELPIHWRIERHDIRWFIDVYNNRPDKNITLLELAKLDFNIVQATCKQELQLVSRWWKETSLAEALPFARDRLVESYFWNLCGVFGPGLRNTRIQMTKVNAFITVIDDIFDVYGTIDELHFFNEVVQGWNVEAMEKLPDYMKLCILAVDNFINEMAMDVSKGKERSLIISYLRKSWTDLFGSYLQEAKWFSVGYTPTLEEYMSNAWISISATTMLSHAYFLIADPIDFKAVEEIYKYHNIIKCSGMILRLANDVGTSPDEMLRGDVAKSIDCYMKEKGVSREEAVQRVRAMIGENWKRMNDEVSRMIMGKDQGMFPAVFVRWAMDVGRMAQYMYQYGDGHGHQTPEMKNRISALLFHSIPLLDL